MLRACMYRLLARFLGPPRIGRRSRWRRQLEGDPSELGRALAAFARTARVTSASEACDEYDRLMIGLVRGELVPYASFYLTGFLHERPLAAVRSDFARLGITRSAGCEGSRGSHRQPVRGDGRTDRRQLRRRPDRYPAAVLRPPPGAMGAPVLRRPGTGAGVAALRATWRGGRRFMDIEATAFAMAA